MTYSEADYGFRTAQWALDNECGSWAPWCSETWWTAWCLSWIAVAWAMLVGSE